MQSEMAIHNRKYSDQIGADLPLKSAWLSHWPMDGVGAAMQTNLDLWWLNVELSQTGKTGNI